MSGAGAMGMRRLARWLVPFGAIALFCVRFPPIELRSRAEVELARAAAQFSAQDFVTKFWNEHLTPPYARALDAAGVLAAVARDPAEAGARHGRRLGIGGNCTFYLRGSGRVVAVTPEEVRLVVVNEDRTDTEAVDVVIPLGPVFGNAVRDGTGLLDSSAFPNAQQFNDVAAALNAIVEMQVLPELQRIASVGARIAFVGCAELDEESGDPLPLELVPVFVEREEI